VKYGVYLYPPAGSAVAAEVVRLAEAAESLGFDSAWLGDHVAWPARFDPSSHDLNVGGATPPKEVVNLPVFEPITTLTFVAATVPRIKLGLGVLVAPYRNPVLAAKMLAMLDILSGGRLIVGVGAGWLREEFAMLDAPSYADRGQVTDEYLQAFIELWTQPEPHFHGKHAHVSDVRLNPKPVQVPHPPIWVGGNGLPAMRRAAAFGQGWMPLHQSPAQMKTKVQQFHQVLVEQGREVGHFRVAVGCGLRFDATGGAAAERDTLTGTTAEIIQQLRLYADAGVDEVRLLNHGYSSVEDLVACWARFMKDVATNV
jgi:probable F420-dependent oxidoreductase